MNVVMIQGEILREPELIFCKNGGKLTKLSIGIRRQDMDSEAVIDRVDVQVWNANAEWAVANLHQGVQVVVEAQVKCNDWVDPKTNEPRSTLVINATSVLPVLTR